MAGKQAKVLTDRQIKTCLAVVSDTRYPLRNRVLVLLSHKAGLRACEMARLRWSAVLGADGEVGEVLELPDGIAKRGSGRTIPLNSDLREALIQLHAQQDPHPSEAIISSERGAHLTPDGVVAFFAWLYRAVGAAGASSHSGRRGFITRAARRIAEAGGSLRDVQQLAGHRSLATTQRYIEGDTQAKRRVVNLI